MGTHQKHHYVPASFFKPWCNQNGLMTYFRWHGDKFIVDTTSPKSATKEYLLYALHGAPEQLVVKMETHFFTPHIDNPGAEIVQRLASKGVDGLSTDQRHLWTRFIMALHARRPEAIKSARENGRKILLEALIDVPEYTNLRTGDMPDSLVDFVEPWFLENFGMVTMPSIIDHETTHETIMSMRWWCLDFSTSDFDLITSDRPLIWPLPADDPDFYLFIPLGPKLCFFAAKREETVRRIRNTSLNQLVRRINGATINQSFQYVYAAHDRHRLFVERRLRKAEL